MSEAHCHNCGCPTPEVVEIPGAPGVNGADGAPGVNGTNFGAIPPAAGSPEGSVVAGPGVTFLNSTDQSFWVKATGVGNTGWIQLIGPTS